MLLTEFNQSEQIRPSSGFVLSVMDAIHEQTAEPPPIPFPWKRMLPGAIAALCALLAFLIWASLQTRTSFSSNYSVSLLALSPLNATLGWITLALVLTLVLVSLSFRLAGGRQR
jgi:heme A synthase